MSECECESECDTRDQLLLGEKVDVVSDYNRGKLLGATHAWS